MAEKQQANLWRLRCCGSAFSRCLACLHTCLFLTARWPKFDLSISQRTPLQCFFHCQLYVHSLGSESFLLSSSLPEIEITRQKKLSGGWVNFENRINRLEATTCFLLHVTEYYRPWKVQSSRFIQPTKQYSLKRVVAGNSQWKGASPGPKRNPESGVIATRGEGAKRADLNVLLAWWKSSDYQHWKLEKPNSWDDELRTG